MEKWLNVSNSRDCDVCKKDLNITKKMKYCKMSLPNLFFLPILSIIIFITISFIIDINKTSKDNHYKISITVLVIFTGLYLIYNFIIRFCKIKLHYTYSLLLPK